MDDYATLPSSPDVVHCLLVVEDCGDEVGDRGNLLTLLNKGGGVGDSSPQLGYGVGVGARKTSIY